MIVAAAAAVLKLSLQLYRNHVQHGPKIHNNYSSHSMKQTKDLHGQDTPDLFTVNINNACP